VLLAQRLVLRALWVLDADHETDFVAGEGVGQVEGNRHVAAVALADELPIGPDFDMPVRRPEVQEETVAGEVRDLHAAPVPADGMPRRGAVVVPGHGGRIEIGLGTEPVVVPGEGLGTPRAVRLPAEGHDDFAVKAAVGGEPALALANGRGIELEVPLPVEIEPAGLQAPVAVGARVLWSGGVVGRHEEGSVGEWWMVLRPYSPFAAAVLPSVANGRGRALREGAYS